MSAARRFTVGRRRAGSFELIRRGVYVLELLHVHRCLVGGQKVLIEEKAPQVVVAPPVGLRDAREDLRPVATASAGIDWGPTIPR